MNKHSWRSKGELKSDFLLWNPALIYVGPQDSIKSLNRADVGKSLLVSQNWCVHVLESIAEHNFWDCPYF